MSTFKFITVCHVGHTHATGCMWMPENNLWKSVLSFHPADPGNPLRLHGKYLYLLTYLTGPKNHAFLIITKTE